MKNTVTWVPPMDVYERDDNYVLDAELPGVEQGDIKMEFSGLEFTIKGERHPDVPCSKESYHRLEGHRGRFHRTFSLPKPVDRNRMQWELKDGVLHVVLPKSGRAKDGLRRDNR
jgi:HSP20 family protein